MDEIDHAKRRLEMYRKSLECVIDAMENLMSAGDKKASNTNDKLAECLHLIVDRISELKKEVEK